MDSFDSSAGWVILSPIPVMDAVQDLARGIAALRRRDGLDEQQAPAILDAAGPAPEDSVPIIVLNLESAGNEQGGYTWRTGRGRVEIYGDSRRGLGNGIYSFLAALGFRWPQPGQELLPPRPPGAGGAEGGEPGKPSTGIYPLETGGVYVRSDPAPEHRRRLVIPPHTPGKQLPALYRWAARNRVDALVISLQDQKMRTAEAERWGLIIERGGWDLSFLVPRRYIFFKRDLFRMEGGKRTGDHHFCPTNPETIEMVQRRMAALLKTRAAMRDAAPPPARQVYHLWPDQGAEQIWCACPACRAFNPREQIRLAVNTAAAVIAERDPQALVSCRGEEESPPEQLPGGSELTLRPNVFALPGGEGPAPGETLYLYEGGQVKAL
jgi:hypothetical protein